MQNYEKLSDLLNNEECKTYVHKLLHQNPAEIALQYRDKIPCDASVLAYIVKLYQKAKTKLPAWVDNHCILTTKSYAQSTSQIVALYKSTFIKGKKLLVLGGGLGVDEWAFAQTFHQVTSVDNDADLNKSVAFNNQRLKISNVERITQAAEDYIHNSSSTFDCIYTDPDRRDEDGVRKKTLQNSTPNIIALLPQLFSVSNTVIIKASPLVDINLVCKEVKAIFWVHVIAQNNEVKEVLFCLNRNYVGEISIKASNYNNALGWQVYTTTKSSNTIEESNNEAFFYEPNTAIIKAGLSNEYAASKGLTYLDNNVVYYTSSGLHDDFFGRSFKIQGVVEFSKRNVNNYLKEQGIRNANVAKRNFRLSVEELKKLTGIKDGGEQYLFFTSKLGKPVMIHCTKV